jgi:glycosyltransferase involved in cell wall biosynthesis
VNIGVDATCLQNTRGYGRHARSLLNALVQLDADRNRYAFFLDAPEAVQALPAGVDVRLVRATAPAAQAASADGHRSIRDSWRMSRALSDSRFDVLFFPTVYTYLPVFSRARKLVMVHDVIPETFPELTLPSRPARALWNLKSALGRRQARALATVSEYSRRGIVERFKLSPERVHVVGEAPDPIFRVLADPRPTPRLLELGLGDGRPTICYVGGFGPHKNLDALVTATANIVASPHVPDLRLVLVGEYRAEVFYSQADALQLKIRSLDLDQRVVFTGYLPDSDLVALLNCSTVLALPSLMEGFGLPAIEAAACGCPVVATTASPLPELLGDGALYVDPRRPAALERALTTVLRNSDLRQHMRSAGLQAVGRLTWESAAHQLRSALESAAA